MVFDIIGNIAIMHFPEKTKKSQKLKEAKKLLKEKPSIKTVLEKSKKVSGRLRTLKTKFLAGQKTKEALYKENSCKFKLNVETCYFSPRLAEERKQVAKEIKSKEKVLVLFSGVAPFPIVIAKLSGCKEIVAIELSRECNKYAKGNVKRNKVEVEIIQGDVGKRVPGIKEKFDKIVMARPNLKDSFLDVAFPKIKKGGMIYYYGFYNEKDIGDLKELIEKEAKKAKKKIKILKIKKAGDIAPYKFRYRVDILVQ